MCMYIYIHTHLQTGCHYSAFILPLSLFFLGIIVCLFVCFVVFGTLCHLSLCVQYYQCTSTHTHPPTYTAQSGHYGNDLDDFYIISACF